MVVDGTGRTLIPGLIDAHVHLDFLSVRSTPRSWFHTRFVLPRALRELVEHGVTIAALFAGPDSMVGAMPANTLHDELRRMVEAGMTASDALRAATADAADLLGLPDRGVIAPGHRADLVLLGSNPLERIENVADIDLVLRDGVVVHRVPAPPPALVMPRWRRFWGATLGFDARTGDLVRQQLRGKRNVALSRV